MAPFEGICQPTTEYTLPIEILNLAYFFILSSTWVVNTRESSYKLIAVYPHHSDMAFGRTTASSPDILYTEHVHDILATYIYRERERERERELERRPSADTRGSGSTLGHPQGTDNPEAQCFDTSRRGCSHCWR